jgi:hypothetical protein
MLPHVPDAPKRVPPFSSSSNAGPARPFVLRHSSFAEGPEVERVLRRFNPFLNNALPHLVHAPSIDSSRASR